MSFSKESEWVITRNFVLCLGLCTGRFRLGWAIEKVLYDKALHVGLGSILRTWAKEKQNQKRQWNLAASVSEQSMQGPKDYVCLVGIYQKFPLL